MFGHGRLRYFDSQLAQFPLNAGCSHNGFASLMCRIRLRISAATFGLPGSRRDSRVQYQAKALRCQAITLSGHERCEDYGANRATSREQNPQKPVGALEAQTRQRVLLENGKLVTKRDVLRLQGGTVSKAAGDQRQKSDEKKTYRDPTRIS
jgi:hypothetical protein